jgi:hypothetical protein
VYAREAIREITLRVRAMARQQNLDEVYVDEEGTTAIRRGPSRVKLENDNGLVMIHRKGVMPAPIGGTQLDEDAVQAAAESIVRYLRDPSSM